jgi:hypothetical protein
MVSSDTLKALVASPRSGLGVVAQPLRDLPKLATPATV